jgi:alpha-D-ribose 1-methylphosphonate 5-triphosphate synthase subunit PhnH
MIRETTYDEIHDAQRHFRAVLDAMSRPGRICRLHSVALTCPPGLHAGSACVAFALFNADVTFHLAGYSEGAETYLRANSHSRPAIAEKADYLFLHGQGDAAPLQVAAVGTPSYPETGATAIIQVGRIGKSSGTGGLALSLTGPGIEHRETAFVTDLSPALLEALKARNTEFPLGIDAILISHDDCVLCLPRTTRVEWQQP